MVYSVKPTYKTELWWYTPYNGYNRDLLIARQSESEMEDTIKYFYLQRQQKIDEKRMAGEIKRINRVPWLPLDLIRDAYTFKWRCDPASAVFTEYLFVYVE